MRHTQGYGDTGIVIQRVQCEAVDLHLVVVDCARYGDYVCEAL